MNKATSFLLVDDDLDDTSLFGEILGEVSPFVALHSALNGQEALNLLRSGNTKLPDVIFLDLNMPRMDGKQCLYELKKDDTLKQIPVIMFTTSSQSKDIEQTMQSGAVCFITKPANIKELKIILSSIADNVHGNLERTLRTLSDTADTFIVC